MCLILVGVILGEGGRIYETAKYLVLNVWFFILYMTSFDSYDS